MLETAAALAMVFAPESAQRYLKKLGVSITFDPDDEAAAEEHQARLEQNAMSLDTAVARAMLKRELGNVL